MALKRGALDSYQKASGSLQGKGLSADSAVFLNGQVEKLMAADRSGLARMLTDPST